MNYQEFLEKKRFNHIDAGFDCVSEMSHLYDFQEDITRWALRRGKSAIFADTGLGKTAMQVTWADEVHKHTDKPVLIVAPLCVANQTVRESKKFGIESRYIRSGVGDGNIHVTNYEMLKNFDPDYYSGIVLDESSILKGMDGKMRKYITDFAINIPYRLSCTATPSPNDFMELGTQSEFLGIMSQVEMLAMFFIHDGSDTSKWRLKGHGRRKFWEWLSTWAAFIRNPADLGYKADGYDLPPIKYVSHVVETEPDDGLFVVPAQGLLDRNRARKSSVDARVEIAAEVANGINEPCIIWCNLNDESAKLSALINNSVEVVGSDSPDKKESSILAFTDGEIQKIVTKPKIAGFGLNWQHCRQMIFVGLSDSFESYYQAVRRCWRFGQTKQVIVHIISADTEGGVVANIRRKEKQHREIADEMAKIMKDYTIAEIKGTTPEKTEYLPDQQIKKPTFMRAS